MNNHNNLTPTNLTRTIDRDVVVRDSFRGRTLILEANSLMVVEAHLAQTLFSSGYDPCEIQAYLDQPEVRNQVMTIYKISRRVKRRYLNFILKLGVSILTLIGAILVEETIVRALLVGATIWPTMIALKEATEVPRLEARDEIKTRAIHNSLMTVRRKY